MRLNIWRTRAEASRSVWAPPGRVPGSLCGFSVKVLMLDLGIVIALRCPQTEEVRGRFAKPRTTGGQRRILPLRGGPPKPTERGPPAPLCRPPELTAVDPRAFRKLPVAVRPSRPNA